LIDPISWSYSWPYIAAALACGYLLGSVPFGLLLTRFAGLGDIRGIGSGNIGATNVLRTGRKSLAAATLLLDAGKGALTVMLGDLYGPDIAIVAGLGAMLGHLFPVWLRFQGGKGVATALGVILALSWQTGLAALMVWIAVAALFRYSSLAALVAAAAAPVIAWFIATQQLAEFFALIAVLVWMRHAGNIRRLIRGEESRIGAK
jgi:glycerol-3-phosphate acyltransferase PlsY